MRYLLLTMILFHQYSVSMTDLLPILSDLQKQLVQLQNFLQILEKQQIPPKQGKKEFPITKLILWDQLPQKVSSLTVAEQMQFDTTSYVTQLLMTNKTLVDQEALRKFAEVWPSSSGIASFIADRLAFDIMKASPRLQNICSPVYYDKVITSIALHPHRNIVALGDEDGRITLFDVSQLKNILSWGKDVTEAVGIRQVAFDPIGNTIAAGYRQKAANLGIFDFDITNKTIVDVRIINAHTDDVIGIAFNNAGTMLASISDNADLKLWNTKIWKLTALLRSHQGYGHSVSFNSNDTLLASGAMDGTVKIWDVQNQTLLKTLIKEGKPERTRFEKTQELSTAVFHPKDPNMLAVALSEDNAIRLYNPQNDQYTAHIKYSGSDIITSLSFDPREEKIAARDYVGNVHIIDLLQGKETGLIAGITSTTFSSSLFDHTGTRIITSYEYSLRNIKGLIAIWYKFNVPGDEPNLLAWVIKRLFP